MSASGEFVEERLILAVVLGREEEAARWAARADWKRTAALADRELIGGYLHRRIEATSFARLAPPSFLAHLAASYRKTAFDNLLLLARLKDVVAALAGAQVPFIILKGGALITDLYPDPGTRALTDIDLLVPRPRAGDARDALARLGWEREGDFQIAARRCGFLSPPPGKCLFEIHWDLSQRYRYQADLDRLWEGARPMSLEGIDALRLGDADEFLYLTLHYAAHYFGMTIKWLIDLFELIRRRPPDWSDLGKRAREWRGSAALHAALLFVHERAPELLSREELALAGAHPILDRLLSGYRTDDPLRFLRDLPYGPRRLLLAALLQDRFRDRIGLAWLTQVRGHRHDD